MDDLGVRMMILFGRMHYVTLAALYRPGMFIRPIWINPPDSGMTYRAAEPALSYFPTEELRMRDVLESIHREILSRSGYDTIPRGGVLASIARNAR